MRTNFLCSGTKRIGRANALAFGLAVIVALLLLGLQSATKPAHAATTFTVNSTGDAEDANFNGGSPFGTGADGKCDVDTNTTGDQCTLRAAIEEANYTPNSGGGPDLINFNIPDAGPHTITPSPELPQIIDPVTIDGYTEPGSSANTLVDAMQGTNAKIMIELDGGAASTGLDINASNVVVKGLAIHSFTNWGILATSAADTLRIEGNFIGTDAGGIQDKGNGTNGIEIDDATNFTLGGEAPAARNLISGNGSAGLYAPGANISGAEVMGNLIGTTKDGKSPLPNGNGGVEFASFESSANGQNNNFVGGSTVGSANVIAYNSDRGVIIFGDETKVSVLRNSIFSNAGEGISLPLTSPFDALDADTGPNGGQNFPVITSAKTSRKATTIKGTLDSKPNQIYTLMFFSTPAANIVSPPEDNDNREGKIFKVQKNDVFTDSAGHADFSVKLKKGKIPKGQVVTATATASNGDTSEFSIPKKVGG